MKRLALLESGLLIFLFLSACSEGESVPYQEAVLVPVPVSERHELAGLLASFANRHDFYFRDSSNYIRRTTGGELTVSMVIYRPVADGNEWPEIAASATGDEFPSLTFTAPPEGDYSKNSGVARSMLLSEVKQRWPETKDIPILPHGGIPHTRDLIETPDGLRIDPRKAADYELPSESPLLAT